MAGRLYEIAFKIGGQIAASFPKSMLSATGQLDRVGKQIAQLEKAQGTVTRFRELHREIDATKLKLRQAEGEFKHLGATVGPMSADMAKKFAALPAEIDKLKGKLRGQLKDLQGTGRDMAAAGVQRNALGSVGSKLAQAQAQQRRLQEIQGAAAASRKAKEAAQARFEESKGKLMGAAAGVAAFAVPVVVAAKFEDSMVRAGALAKANDAEYAKLSAQARQLGKDERFSATQAAEGMQYLAQSGFNSAQIMGAMPGMLKIAAAGMVDVGEAADITANILKGFDMDARETGRLGDVLTNTFTNSNTTLSTLGETMKYVAPIAKATGVSLELTAAAAGTLGNAGIKGGEAGTALRAMLSRLAAPPKMAQDALAQLGVKTKYTTGKLKGQLVPLDQVLTNLSKKMEKFGSGTRQGMITAIFGMEAASAATVLLKEAGAGNLQKFAKAVEESGTAARIADKQNATMAGQWDNIKGSVEEVGIAIGNQLIPALKDLIGQVVPVINKVSEWMKDNPELTQTLIKAAAGVAILNLALVGGGIAGNGLIVAFHSGKAAMWAMQLASKALKVDLIAIGGTVGALALILGALFYAGYEVGKNWDQLKSTAKEVWGDIKKLVSETVEYIKNINLYEAGKGMIRTLIDGITSIGDPRAAILGAVADKVSGLFRDQAPRHYEIRNMWKKQRGLTAADVTSSANVPGAAYGMSSPDDLGSGVGSLDAAGKLSGGSSIRTGGDVTLNYAPKIEVSGGEASAVRAEVEKALAESQKGLGGLGDQFRKLMEQQRRVALGD
jgi:TP901 family phage tail tape measure protein